MQYYSRRYTLQNTGQKTSKNTENTKRSITQEKVNNAKHSRTKLAWFSCLAVRCAYSIRSFCATIKQLCNNQPIAFTGRSCRQSCTN